jgi:HTH-like domain
MRFQLIDRAKQDFPVHRLCEMLGVSQSGYFAWKDRPASRRQRDDMVMLAHVRSAFALSNGTYASPRMTRELQDEGFAIGRRRTARLMRENGLRGRQKRRFKRTTDSEHAWPIAPNIIDQDFSATAPNQKWGVDISYVWTREGWLYLAVVIDPGLRRGRLCFPAVSSVGRSAIGCTAIWRWRPCAKPSSCGDRPKGSFTIRIAAANIVPWNTRPSYAAIASVSPCRQREIATIVITCFGLMV